MSNKVKAIICIEANNHDSVVIHLDDEIIGQKMLNVECMNAIARLHIESFHATNKRIALSAALKNSAEKQKQLIQQLAEHEKQASLAQQSSGGLISQLTEQLRQLQVVVTEHISQQENLNASVHNGFGRLLITHQEQTNG